MSDQPKKRGCGCCMPILVIMLIFFIMIAAIVIEAHDRLIDPEESQAAEGSASVFAPPIAQDSHVFNILIVGHDYREGEAGQRSDAMVLCTVDPQGKKVVMTSFLRDLYVQIPGHGSDRLNAAYSFGGIKLLNQTLKQNFGIRADYNVEVSFSQFEQIIDLFGGVSIELTKKEADHLGGGLKEGVNHLTAAQTLNYARIRKLDSDFGRTERQRKVISALLDEMKGMTATELTALLRKLPDLMTTDMSYLDMGACAFMVMPSISKMEFIGQHIPADGTYQNQTIDKKAVLVPDLEANIAILKDTIGS